MVLQLELGGLRGAAKGLGGKQKEAELTGNGFGETAREFGGVAWGFAGKQGGAEGPRVSEPSPFVSWAAHCSQPLPQATCSASRLAPGLLSKLASGKQHNRTLHRILELNCDTMLLIFS